MSAALSSEGPAPAGLAQGLLELGDLRRQGCLTAEQYALQVKYLVWEFSTPDLPPLSNGANGAIVATATPAVASAAASSVAPAGDGRSPLGDSSECGLNGTSVPLNGAAIGTPRSLSDGVGRCLALPSKEGPPMGAPSTVALTDDGGRPIIHDPRANDGPVPGTPVWDRWLSESPARLASIIAHRKGPSSAHDSSISNAAASASPSPGQLNPPIKDSKSSGAAALDPGSWPRTPTDGVRVEKVRHDDDGHALAGGIAPTALFPEPPPPSEVASRATAATRLAFSGAPLVVLFVYISI